MILAIGFLLLISLVVSAGLSALGSWWGPLFGGWEILLQAVNFLVAFVVVSALFAIIYKFLPRAKIGWHDVWIGAAATALLFTLGKFLIGLYIGKSSVASGFGAAGSLVVVLVWVYYSAQIFLLGAEFTWVYAFRHGSRRGETTNEGNNDHQQVPSKTTVTAANDEVSSSPASVPWQAGPMVRAKRSDFATVKVGGIGALVAVAVAAGWRLGKRLDQPKPSKRHRMFGRSRRMLGET